MNQEKTKHKFHEVLKWIADGEQVEYLTSTGEWVTEQSKDILWCVTQHPERYKQDRFRIKPKITTKTISGTFFLKCVAHGSKYDTSEVRLETYNKVSVEDFVELSTDLVRIISNEWYNELISCKEQLDKLKFN